jgi:hypothetical protein
MVWTWVTGMTLTGMESNCVHSLSAFTTTEDKKTRVKGWTGRKTYAKVLEEILGLGVDVELAALGVLGEVESRHLRNVLILALTLLLLQLEGDTADGTTLDTLHEMGGVAGNLFFAVLSEQTTHTLAVFSLSRLLGVVSGKTHLVAQALRGNDGDLVADALVGLEVEGQLGVVPLNDDLGGLLDCLSANATHFGDLMLRLTWTGLEVRKMLVVEGPVALSTFWPVDNFRGDLVSGSPVRKRRAKVSAARDMVCFNVPGGAEPMGNSPNGS